MIDNVQLILTLSCFFDLGRNEDSFQILKNKHKPLLVHVPPVPLESVRVYNPHIASEYILLKDLKKIFICHL